MKKIFVIALLSLGLCSCGVGSYSVSSGKADEAEISFAAPRRCDLTVTIDSQTYRMQAVKTKAWKSGRRIKPTALNTRTLTPGQHDLSVESEYGKKIEKKIFVSAGEHKVIEL